MRIEELHLKNFRCFKELDIKFPASNLAVFIGLNGSGKTAILDAIISSLLNLDKHHGITKHITSELFFDDDINIESNELNMNVNISCNSYSVSWSILKKKDDIQKIENIEGKISEFEKKLMETPNFTISQYTAKREKKFVHQGYPHLVIIDFDVFKKRFIEEVDAENRIIIENKDFTRTNPKLNVIRKAIEVFCSNISNMCISNLRTKDIKENTNIVMDWDGLELSLSQLSEGQRNLLLLISDIAFSLLNPMGSWTDRGKSEDILNRNGIVLIDEIELHLHPQWQREVIPALQKTFPNIQFIVTTHSPQVLSRVHKDNIFILKDNEIFQPSINPIGRDSNDILDEIMGVTKRPEEIQELSDKYFSLINKNLLNEAQEVRNLIIEKLDKDDPIFVRANAMITRKQLLKNEAYY
ncbi:MAG: AAA family ATPase [Methylococcales bacterium]|nr:AAA family ATPase [Methylococcales bacterium]